MKKIWRFNIFLEIVGYLEVMARTYSFNSNGLHNINGAPTGGTPDTIVVASGGASSLVARPNAGTGLTQDYVSPPVPVSAPFKV